MNLKPKPCIHCGSDPVLHGMEKMYLVAETITRTFLSPLDNIVGLVLVPLNYFTDKIMPVLVNVMHKIGIGKITTSLDEFDVLRTVCLWEEAEKKGIRMYQYRPVTVNKGFFIAEKNGKRIFFDAMPRPNRHSTALMWMDNKTEFKKRSRNKGFPVAKGDTAFTLSRALEIFRSIEKPVIAKPHSGSATRHTTLHIDSEEELKSAFKIAKKLSPFIVIEEELSGDVYRPTLVDGKLIGVLGRTPPFVIGDGVKTIRELIEVENMNPKRNGPYFHKIKMDEDEKMELKRQGFDFDDVPEKGKKIRLHQKINWSVGGTTYDITDNIHPENKKLFEDMAEFLGDSIVGLDFIIEDITKSWKEQKKCGFIECNGMPFIDNHHYPFEGEVRNVAGAVWDMIFEEKRK